LKQVIINGRMQRNYRYTLVAPIGRSFHPEFRPELTPKEMAASGPAALGLRQLQDLAEMASCERNVTFGVL
jgi:hypothetical protein